MSHYVLNIQTKLNPGVDKMHIYEYLKKKKKKQWIHRIQSFLMFGCFEDC